MAEAADSPDVSIVIALAGDPQRIPVLMAHLERQTYPASRMEVLLVVPPFDVPLHEAAVHSAEGAPIPTRILTAGENVLTAALNEGIRAAHGVHLLLLDEDLLPSPHWVEHHLEAQQRLGGDGPCCTVGALRPHPQLEKHALTAWFLSGARGLGSTEAKLGYLDWRRNNLCLPRETLLRAGGFDERFTTPHFADAELACRLSRQGVRGHYLPSAVAYIAYASTFADELERHYHKGAGLHRLHESTGDGGVFKRYPVKRNAFRRLLDAFFVPFYIRACMQTEENTHLLGHVYTRIFFYQRCLGYQHAVRAATLKKN